MSKLLLYCCKSKPYLLYEYDKHYGLWDKLANDLGFDNLNGKIVAECDFEVKWESTDWGCITFKERQGLEKSCLTKEQLFDYVKGRNEFYAIHIKNLHIFDKPKELSEYYSIIDMGGGMLGTKPLIKAPQNMMNISINHWEYCFYNPSDINILISIQPQWLCKILNGEKTIEVRKKVLKEMLK